MKAHAIMKSKRSWTRLVKICGTLLPAVLTADCSVWHEFVKPQVSVPTTFRSQIATTEARSFADLPWWEVFDDRALQALITEALANNYDLQVTVAKIEQARALVGVAESEGKPQIGYQANASGQNEIVAGFGKPQTLNYGTFSGLLTAAWELDVWGRIRYSTESARANLFAQEDVRRGVILTLVSDIATDYFKLIELDRELAIAEESVRVYRSTLDLFTSRFEAGRDSRLPVERTQADYDLSNADVQDLRRQIAQMENAISTLIGTYPRAIERGMPLEAQTAPETPIGTTTALLQRRPDILGAEQTMIGANAEIGVAVANYFPRVGLSAFVGGEGANVGGNWIGFAPWNIALSAAGPIYSGGRLQEEYRNRQAYWDETVSRYKQTVLVAFHETADALVAQQTLVQRRASLESQVRALMNSADLALTRYQAGRASYFEVLEAQQQLFPAQDALAQTMRDQLLAIVSLYKALGGGWNAPEGQQPPAPSVNTYRAQLPTQAGG
jgi:multidrug efflux system outer membrane protein